MGCHEVIQPRFPVIDYHNHLDGLDPRQVLRVMDACDVEKAVNIAMETGEAALGSIDRFHRAAPNRFASIGWMDWSGVERSDFVQVTLGRLERLVEHGAVGIKFWKDLGLKVQDANGTRLRIDDERLAPIFDKAADLKIPVMFHTADPTAFSGPSIASMSDMKSSQLIPIGVSATRRSQKIRCSRRETRSSGVTRTPHLCVRISQKAEKT